MPLTCAGEQAAYGILAVIDLVSATKALIATCLTQNPPSMSAPITTTVYCRHCVRGSVAGKPIEHASNCVVGQAAAAVEAVEAVRPFVPPLPEQPTFSETETVALRRMQVMHDADQARATGQTAPKGILGYCATPLSPVKSRFEQNFVTGRPERHIEYEAVDWTADKAVCGDAE